MIKSGPLRGIYDVVMGRENWESQFDLSRRGLQKSFYLILLLFPAFYIFTYAIQKARAAALGQADFAVGQVKFFALSSVLIFSFAIGAYVIAMIIDKQDRFRPWVIVRHWSMVALMAVPTLAFGLSIIGWVPLNFALSLAMIAALFSLVVDIRIIQEVLDMKFGNAALLACVMTMITLLILTAGLSYMGSTELGT